MKPTVLVATCVAASASLLQGALAHGGHSHTGNLNLTGLSEEEQMAEMAKSEFDGHPGGALHGFLMTVVVLFSMPWGIASAWRERRGLKAWPRPKVHKWIQTGNLLVMTFAAVYMAFVELKEEGDAPMTAHGALGWVTILVMWLQAALGFLTKIYGGFWRQHRIHSILGWVVFALVNIQFVFGIYHVVSSYEGPMGKDILNHLIGHQGMFLFFLVIGCVQVFNYKNIEKVEYLEPRLIIAGAIAYMVGDFAVKDNKWSFGTTEAQHNASALLWISCGIFCLTMKNRGKSTGLGIALAFVMHSIMILHHPQHVELGKLVHVIHAFFGVLSGIFRVNGRIFEGGVLMILAGFELVFSQPAFVLWAVRNHIEGASFVLMVIILALFLFCFHFMLWRPVEASSDTEGFMPLGKSKGKQSDVELSEIGYGVSNGDVDDY